MEMRRTQRIQDRFPHFFMTWDKESSIHKIVAAIGKRLDEADREEVRIMRSHWVDKAYGSDLDRMGALFNIERMPVESDIDYRNRLKRSIIEYKGGGTINAIISSLRMGLGLPDDCPIEIMENPPEEVRRDFKVNPGDTWSFSGESIHDVRPIIELSVESESGGVSNPTLENLDTGEELTYTGEIKTGDKLIVGDGKATLNKRSVKKNISATQAPILTRKMATWSYTEPISEEIGVFDTAIFDESKYAIGISTVNVGFNWVAHQPATFEVRIPRAAVSTSERLELAGHIVNSIKAAGVRSSVTPVEVE